MRIASNALSDQLEKGLSNTYLIFGAEPLLIEESADMIRRTARQQGIDEVLRFTAGVDLDWQQILDTGQSLSLFSTRRLLEIRLPTGKPGDAGAKALIEFIEKADPSDHLSIILGRVDKAVQSSKWFKTVESSGTSVEARAVTAQQLPAWISDRLRAHGVKATRGAIDRLAYYSEGNLLFAAQEINKLPLLLGERELDESGLEVLVADQARFSVFALVDEALAGKAMTALRMLYGLQREGNEAILINWAIAREVRALYAMSKEMAAGADQRNVFQQFRVWRSRERYISAALKRLSSDALGQLLSQLAFTDRVIKGRTQTAGGAWAEVERAVLLLCGITMLQRNTVLND